LIELPNLLSTKINDLFIKGDACTPDDRTMKNEKIIVMNS